VRVREQQICQHLLLELLHRDGAQQHRAAPLEIVDSETEISGEASPISLSDIDRRRKVWRRHR
jgi:hypothetical protein